MEKQVLKLEKSATICTSHRRVRKNLFYVSVLRLFFISLPGDKILAGFIITGREKLNLKKLTTVHRSEPDSEIVLNIHN